MTGKTPSLCGGAVLLALSATIAPAAPAMPGTPWKRAEIFATCSGRLAALAARQQAEGNPDLEATLEHRDMFDLMLEATLPDAVAFGVPESQPVRWRSEGWTETAVLLADISYSFDSGRAKRARAALDTRIGDCRGLLLGG